MFVGAGGDVNTFLPCPRAAVGTKNITNKRSWIIARSMGRWFIRTLKDALRQDWGYWESKDAQDDLEAEIKAKFAKGYPKNNMLFEDTQAAVLYQSGEEVGRASLRDAEALDGLLRRFVNYETQELRNFREAVEGFAQEVPELALELRAIIEQQMKGNHRFKRIATAFLMFCQEAINPSVEMADVREMIIQHLLTQDIFVTVFDESQFHQENNIALKLGEVVSLFYRGATRRKIHHRILPYYTAIHARASQIHNHHEKQKFLKVLYEHFYKAYNPKAADRLGIVYTPNEIVRFMIEAADYLCFKHFGKTLGDKGVEILAPATGTGTFITELIEYLPESQLAYKYQDEIHRNEVAILPYYIANLNIEYTYQQKMGEYVEFENIVFVDTLDNMGFAYQGKQLDLFGLADENAERIKRQNEREVSVIIGNPPYNANQKNENENNKNRAYPEIDKRIKATYVDRVPWIICFGVSGSIGVSLLSAYPGTSVITYQPMIGTAFAVRCAKSSIANSLAPSLAPSQASPPKNRPFFWAASNSL